MPYVSSLCGLGIDPVTAVAVTKFGWSGLKKLFGTAPPAQPFPWRWDKPGREVGFTGFPNPNPGHFGIVYGTEHQWFRVWDGSVSEVFGSPSFDVSGTIDGGKRAWRAYVTQGRLQLMEDFGQGWVPVFAGTKQQMIDWTGHIGPIPLQRVAVGAVPAVAPERMPVVAAGMFPDLGAGSVPLLIAAGLALMFVVKR